MKIDFHNHLYPEAYLVELEKGDMRATVQKDAEGRTLFVNAGDYSIILLLGSDYPHQIGDLPGAVQTIEKLPIADEDRRKILGQNAARLLKLS